MYLTAFGNGIAEWSMLNRIINCETNACSTGVQFGGAGKGDINASEISSCRIGGYANAVQGIYIMNGYANNIDKNDVEIFPIGIKYNANRNILKGNLCEQNDVDIQCDDSVSKMISLANEFNTVSSLEAGSHIGDNDLTKNLRLSAIGESVLIDSNFATNLGGSAFLGTTLNPSVSSNGDTGKNTCSFDGGSAVADRAMFLVDDKSQGLKGWYTFILKAKSTNGGGIFIKLPSGTHSDYRFCQIKSSTTNYLELLEVNCNTFVVGVGRSGSTSSEYRYYSGSVFFDTDIEVESLRLSAENDSSTFTVDYFGMSVGEISKIPNDNLTLEKEIKINDLGTGNARSILQMPFNTVGVPMVVTMLSSNSDFTSFRSINSMPFMYTNGVSRSRVFWSANENQFSYDTGSSSSSNDHIFGDGASKMFYFSRTADLSAFNNLYCKFDFLTN